jgi:hypothetical protein
VVRMLASVAATMLIFCVDPWRRLLFFSEKPQKLFAFHSLGR